MIIKEINLIDRLNLKFIFSFHLFHTSISTISSPQVSINNLKNNNINAQPNYPSQNDIFVEIVVKKHLNSKICCYDFFMIKIIIFINYMSLNCCLFLFRISIRFDSNLYELIIL